MRFNLYLKWFNNRLEGISQTESCLTSMHILKKFKSHTHVQHSNNCVTLPKCVQITKEQNYRDMQFHPLRSQKTPEFFTMSEFDCRGQSKTEIKETFYLSINYEGLHLFTEKKIWPLLFQKTIGRIIW